MSVVQSQGSMNVDAPIETKGSAIAPGAPKAPAATRRRSQVPVATRISQRLFKKQASEVSGSQQRRSITLERVEDKEQQQRPDAQGVLLLDSHQQQPAGVEAAYPLGSKSSGVVSPVQIDDDSDPMILPEYQASIFSYERELEIKFLPDPDYMSRQSDLQWQYRVQLIEWLVQVHSRFDMLQETMHLCVNYLDRFLSKTIIPVDQLQLAGTVALLLASKYEETQSPAIEDLVYVSGEAYTPARIRQAELEMLRTLNYDLGAPGPMNFLRRISRADHYDVDIRTLAKYLIDVTLCDHRFIGLPSSIIAALSYRASMKLLFRGEWTSKHVSYSGYAEAMLNAGINVLLMVLEQPRVTHSTIFAKYQDKRYMNSSEYVRRLGIAQLRALRV
ncbi:hypothetical protein BGX34_007828 [Mortierella sp. NVP85]|nr:hypothetical protein BGX34_007828 [Mortierella sp. NVP85]